MFTPEFKRQQINRVIRGEATVAELSRELDVARPLLQRWKQLLTQGGEPAIAADEDVVPVSRLRMAEQRIRRPELGFDRPQQAARLREGIWSARRIRYGRSVGALPLRGRYGPWSAYPCGENPPEVPEVEAGIQFAQNSCH